MRFSAYFSTLFLIFGSVLLYGQSSSELEIHDSLKIKNQFVAYPIVFYLPEDKWGGGIAGFYNFRFKGESVFSNPSQIQFSINYTQLKQVIISFPFEIYRSNNKWKLKGDVGYFKYQYNFYGLGINSKFDEREIYRVNFPRSRVDLLRKFNHWFLGLRFRFDYFDIVKTKEGGLVEQLQTGSKGGFICGFGTIAQWDKRDHIYNPTKGHFVELEAFLNHKIFGSDFKFGRLAIDVAKYQKLAKNHTLVLHSNIAYTAGSIPFFEMPYFGSPKFMRGVQDRRFIDKNMLIFQTEYRYPIWKILQGVVFCSTGTVSGEFKDLFSNHFVTAFGAGLRLTLNEKDRTRIRFDFGKTLHEGHTFYVTINDAF